MQLIQKRGMFGAEFSLHIRINLVNARSYLKSIHLYNYQCLQPLRQISLQPTFQVHKKIKQCIISYINSIMMQKTWLGFIISIFILFGHATCKKYFWNEILYYEGELSQKDYVNQQIKQTNQQGEGSNIYKGPFCIQVFSNRTFAFQIDYPDLDEVHPLVITGEAIEQLFQHSTYKFNLTSSKKQNLLKGQIYWNHTHNTSWIYELELPNIGIHLKRQREVSILCYQITKIVLIILMMIVLPTNLQKLSILVYSIRMRTNQVTVMVTGLNIVVLISILVLFEGIILKMNASSNKTQDISLSSILIGLLLLIFMIISLIPLFIHSIYIVSASLSWFHNTYSLKPIQSLKSSIFFILALILLFSVIALFVLTSKGLLFHYLISLSILPTFIRSYIDKKYIHERFVMFDLLIKFSLTLFSLYLPIYSYSLISYKEAVILWSFQFGLVFFGWFIITKRIENSLKQGDNENQQTREMNPWLPLE